MGTSCNVMKPRMRLNPFVAKKWRKDEIDRYTPSPTIHNADLQIDKIYSLQMTEKRHEVPFPQLRDYS